MPKKRPTAVLVIAIFHFIFAACGGIGGLLALTGAAQSLSKMSAGANPKAPQIDVEKMIERSFPAYQTFQTVDGAVTLVMAVVLLAAGLGLLQMQSWARWLSIFYAVVQIIRTLIGLVVAFVYVLPAVKTGFQQLPGTPPEAAKAAEIGATIGAGVGGCIGLIYPVAVLIVMLLPSVGAAFRAPDVEPPRPERGEWGDEDEYDRGERWREQQ